MSNLIATYYKDYLNTVDNFQRFHNNVINMPRPTFSEIPSIVRLLKNIASYIILIDEDKLKSEIGIKEIYFEIFKNYKNGIIPKENRSIDFENNYLNINVDFDWLYSDAGGRGRMFRHYIAFFTYFNYFKIGKNITYRIIDIEALEELVLSSDEILFDVLRSRLLNDNISNNPFISLMRSVNIKKDADYRPCRAILRYCNELDRQATDFELAILLGRIDALQKEDEILSRALNIGKSMPSTREDQEKYFFGCMGWKTDEKNKFEYTPSQNPEFKFKPYLILMDTFGLISYDYSRSTPHTVSITKYAKEIISEDIPMEMIDLQKLLSKIDDENYQDSQLADIIIHKRTDAITKAIKEDGDLVYKLNLRNIKNPIIKNGKRTRNRLISEVAKIKANYLDELTKAPSFEGKNGKNYVEAHHIIEFNGDNGPDITDNLICLGPQNHSLIHHGSSKAIDDFYTACITRGVISFDRFKNICEKYRCLTKKHVKILLSRSLISKFDADELNNLIDIYGVDDSFADIQT